jgi:L-ascorbate metabolism protein UlaG (beta-lactamase superfamily)
MEIVWYGQTCFRLKTRGAIVITDPCGKDSGYELPRMTAHVVTVSLDDAAYNNCGPVRGDPKVIDGPGEYEVRGVFITGIATAMKKDKKSKHLKNTIYLFDFDDGLTVCHLGNLDHVPSSQPQIQALSDVDVLLIPVGGVNTMNPNQAAEVIGLLEPTIVIPMHYKTKKVSRRLQPVDNFLNEMGLPDIAPRDSFEVSKSSLPSETQVVVLSHQE